jgi:hypothetical protein
MGLKRPGRERDFSPAPRAEVKNSWIYSSTPLYAVMNTHRKIPNYYVLLHNRSFVATFCKYHVAFFGHDSAVTFGTTT